MPPSYPMPGASNCKAGQEPWPLGEDDDLLGGFGWRPHRTQDDDCNPPKITNGLTDSADSADHQVMYPQDPMVSTCVYDSPDCS